MKENVPHLHTHVPFSIPEGRVAALSPVIVIAILTKKLLAAFYLFPFRT